MAMYNTFTVKIFNVYIYEMFLAPFHSMYTKKEIGFFSPCMRMKVGYYVVHMCYICDLLPTM